MPLFRLSDPQVRRFREEPEAAMGLHILAGANGELPSFVLGNAVLLTLDDASRNQIAELLQLNWLRRAQLSIGDREAGFERWLASLAAAEISEVSTIQREDLHLAFRLFPPGYLPPAPPMPKYVYGHVPLVGSTGPDDVFYRCEPWPKSRRIDQKKEIVEAGTFAWPATELPLVPSGFAAVGRYALPSLLPACFRWELQPQPGTMMDCGASVPLYGQSGGGVEVRFRRRTSNRGPIANPVVLPVDRKSVV